MYEGAPNAPDWSRFWSIIEKHGVSILYTAPTAIRAFIRAGDEWPAKHDLSSLRLLGSVGEPINPEAWMWYHRVIGGGRCPIVDTWWQTETGSIMLTTLPGACYSKPGSTGLPFVRRRHRGREGPRRRVPDERRRQADHPKAVAVDGAHALGRRRALPQDVLGRDAERLLHRRRRAPRRGRLLLGGRAHRRRPQRRRATASAPPRSRARS